MPYGRRYGKKKGAGKKKVPKNVKKYVKETMDANVENKLTSSLPGAPALDVPDTLQLYLINGISLGTANNFRIGNKVRGKYLRIQGYIENGSQWVANNGQNSLVRFIVFRDNAPNGVAPLSTELLDPGTPTPANPWMFNAPTNINNRNRFKILKDKTIMLVTMGGLQDVPRRVAIDWKFRIPNIVTQFNGAGATFASINKNAYYLAVTSETNGAVQLRVAYSYEYEDA